MVTERQPQGRELRVARRKTDAVMRLLRGEDLDTVARPLRAEAHRLAAWCEEFMAVSVEGLRHGRRIRRIATPGGRAPDRLAHHGARGLQAAGRKSGCRSRPRERRPR